MARRWVRGLAILVPTLVSFAGEAQAQLVWLSPSGGEVWPAGSVQTVRWRSVTGGGWAQLSYVPAPGASEHFLETVVVNPGEGALSFTVPGPPTAGAFIRMTGFLCGIEFCTPESPPFTVSPGVVHEADLAVTVSDGRTEVHAGEALTYSLVVTNGGPSVVTGGRVTTRSWGLAGLAWQCTPSAGSQCSSSGAGEIDDTLTLPPGESATYTLRAVVWEVPAPGYCLGNPASVHAGVRPPLGIIDPSSPNDTQTDTTAVLGIRVDSPNGGEISAVGTQRTILWSTWDCALTGDFEIAFLDGSAGSPVTTVTDTRTYSWTVPSTPAKGRIRVLWRDGSGRELAGDASDGDFSIVNPAPPPKPLDLNGDGKADILWHHQSTGELYAWFLDNKIVIGASYLTPPAFTDTQWQIRAIADLDGDGKVDILWHHQQTGDLYVWLMNGTVVTGGSYLTPRSFADTRWQIRGVSDFNSDGLPDILWHQQQTGELYAWLMDGLAVTSGSYLTPPSLSDPLWQIRGVTDLDRDGKADVLWHHQGTGDLYVWYLDGTVVTRGAYLTPGQFADVRWQIRRVDDFDGDGQPDVLWHHQETGELYVWLLDGSVASRGSYLIPDRFADTRWQIVPR